MNKKDKKIFIIVTVILGVILLGIYGKNLFSIFNPIESGLIQLNVNPSESVFDGDANLVYGDILGRRSGTISGSTRNNGDSDVFQYSVEQTPVTIDTGKNIFRFEFEKSGNGITLGIPEPSPSVSSLGLPYCWQKIKVYKNNDLIDTIKSWGSDSDAWNTKDEFKGKVYKLYDNPSDLTSTQIQLTMSDLGDGNSVGKFFGVCRIFVNDFKVKFSEDSFVINVSSPTQTFVQGSNVTVYVDITNNLEKLVKSDTDIVFSTGTIFGDVLKTFNQKIDLNPGLNRLTFTFPATRPEDKINAEVNAKISYSGSSLSGLNEYRRGYTTYDCFNTNGQGGCEESSIFSNSQLLTEIKPENNINLGIAKSERFSLSISPKPLYLPIENNICLLGYVKNRDNTFCVRDDISELSCFVLGCPNIEGTQYQCTSAGICAETVYISQSCKYDSETIKLLNETEKQSVSNNQICPLGTTCDISNGFCIKSEIFNDLIQCNLATDCPNPCDGKIASCNELNRCSYSGECNVQKIGCVDFGCSDGYVCNEQKNVCEEKKVIKWFNNYELVFGLLFLVLILIFVIYRFRKRRK